MPMKCPVEKYESNEEGSEQCKFLNLAKETPLKYNTPVTAKKYLVKDISGTFSLVYVETEIYRNLHLLPQSEQ